MTRGRRSFLVPEVVQASAMDCGPATMKSLLEGFGIPVSYGRLREACQVDLDGTSIDTVETATNSVGLVAEQVMVPADHLLLDAAAVLPAIVVVRNPSGLTHFVLVWRRHGPLVQVMDPAIGRRWISHRQLLRDLYIHRLAVPASDWRAWAGSDEFLRPLRARLRMLGVTHSDGESLLALAVDDETWRALGTLDAAVRMTASLVDSGGIGRGGETIALVRSLTQRAESIPAAYWFAGAGANEGEVLLRGAVLVRVDGRRRSAPSVAPEDLSTELAAALQERALSPGRQILQLITAEGRRGPALLVAALVVAALGVVVEGLLFRAFFDLTQYLGLARQRAATMALLIAVIAPLLLLDLPIVHGTLRLGRHLEIGLRMAFLRKIPRLGERYFGSRLVSDLAERSHNVDRLRLAPDLGEWFLRTLLELTFTLAGIVWLVPWRFLLIAPCAAIALGIPLLVLPRVQEMDLRLRNHGGALSRFHLDALLGLLPIRTHGAEKPMRRQHDGLLTEWSRAYLSFERMQALASTIGLMTTTGMAVALLFDYVARRGVDGGILLLAYWSQNVITLAHMLTLTVASQFPVHRNLALRLLEPLGATETVTPAGVPTEAARERGVGIEWEGVDVRAGGHQILHEISVAIAPGEHVAIVGHSGAGKSTLVGTLLGWHGGGRGTIYVDGAPLAGERLADLRRATAWIDPAVQLWNRSLLENLLYGSEGRPGPRGVDEVIRIAELTNVLRKLPHGLQTILGEGGGLVSGGEGQRIRLARALMRAGVRLAILDEPFRGLDREQRRALLAAAREAWQGATLLCITHDVGETTQFDRALVIEGGRIVEDGAPDSLAATEGSRYRALLAAEHEVREELWGSSAWRRLGMEGGRLVER